MARGPKQRCEPGDLYLIDLSKLAIVVFANEPKRMPVERLADGPGGEKTTWFQEVVMLVFSPSPSAVQVVKQFVSRAVWRTWGLLCRPSLRSLLYQRSSDAT